ncbi:MAG: Rrf2 family transcriptional regulator [Epulopiscium sp.]|nr:Rrf2 family transcriptional regulator [Candidatus Epulonipiscium sp.]
MRISAKGRYGLASMVYMSQFYNNGEYITITTMADALGLSKIYLEQTFSLLRRAGLVSSVKGAQGGYQLIREPFQITVLDVLSAIETSLFEKADVTVAEKDPALETAMQQGAFDLLDEAIETTLQQVTLYDLLNETEKNRDNGGFMFYI